MKNAIELIKKFFENDDWKFSFDEEKSIFRTGINMNNAIGKINVFIRVREDSYTVYAILNSYAEKECINLVAEYLHRANYGLLNGNFELDYDDGEVRYKMHVDFENSIINDEIVEDSIMLPVFMFDKYGKNLIKVMLGNENAKELIEEIEANTDDV